MLETADAAVVVGSGSHEETAGEPLNLDLNPDENVFMCQIGHLKDWCQDCRAIRVAVPAIALEMHLAAQGLRLLNLFKHLQRLDIVYSSPATSIEQGILTACAELMALKRLSLSGGHLTTQGKYCCSFPLALCWWHHHQALGVWTSTVLYRLTCGRRPCYSHFPSSPLPPPHCREWGA